MGFSASAALVWGIPVLAYDDDGEVTQFWDEEVDDWREFNDGSLVIFTYGHYDEPVGILTTTRTKPITCHCWDGPEAVTPSNLTVSDKVYSKSEDDARAAGLDVSFYASAAWWLVASYA